MLAKAIISAVVPVTDFERARDFYEGVLGLSPFNLMLEEGSVIYRNGGSQLLIYQRATASSGEHTIAGFDVGDAFDMVADALLEKGVIFDTFEIPGVDLPWDERGVLNDGERASAWFKDPDGNVLAINSGL